MFRAAGLPCLFVGLMPYYHVDRLDLKAAPAVPPVEFPLIGGLPTTSSRTTFSLGLPCSPFLEVQKVVDVKFSNEPPAGAKFELHDSPDAKTPSSDNFKNFTTSKSVLSHFNFLSLSTLLVVIALLCFSGALRNKRRLRAEQTAAAESASKLPLQPGSTL